MTGPSSTGTCSFCYRPETETISPLAGLLVCRGCNKALRTTIGFLEYHGYTVIAAHLVGTELDRIQANRQNGTEKAENGSVAEAPKKESGK